MCIRCGSIYQKIVTVFIDLFLGPFDEIFIKYANNEQQNDEKLAAFLLNSRLQQIRSIRGGVSLGDALNYNNETLTMFVLRGVRRKGCCGDTVCN